jgi:hypothetical protein
MTATGSVTIAPEKQTVTTGKSPAVHLEIATTEPEVRISIFSATKSLISPDFLVSGGGVTNSVARSGT